LRGALPVRITWMIVWCLPIPMSRRSDWNKLF